MSLVTRLSCSNRLLGGTIKELKLSMAGSRVKIMHGSSLSMDMDKFVKGLLMPSKDKAASESTSIVTTRAAQHDATKAYTLT